MLTICGLFLAPRRRHRPSFVNPDSLDFLIAAEHGFAVRPRERRRGVGGVAPFELGAGNIVIISPGDVGDVSVFDIDCGERFARIHRT